MKDFCAYIFYFALCITLLSITGCKKGPVQLPQQVVVPSQLAGAWTLTSVHGSTIHLTTPPDTSTTIYNSSNKYKVETNPSYFSYDTESYWLNINLQKNDSMSIIQKDSVTSFTEINQTLGLWNYSNTTINGIKYGQLTLGCFTSTLLYHDVYSNVFTITTLDTSTMTLNFRDTLINTSNGVLQYTNYTLTFSK